MSYLSQQKLIEYFSDTIAECCDNKTDPELVIGAFAKALQDWCDYHNTALQYFEVVSDVLRARV
jgi:hypothetical protein